MKPGNNSQYLYRRMRIMVSENVKKYRGWNYMKGVQAQKQHDIEEARRHNLAWKEQQLQQKKELIDLRILVRQVEQAPITEHQLPPIHIDGYTLTPEQAQLYQQYGGRYNIYTDHITEVKNHIIKDTYRTHGSIGSVTYNYCIDCDTLFFYIYRGGRSREICPNCVDWIKKYPYDEVVSI
jgi:hypothetical protein